MKRHSNKSNRLAFTLIEMLVVIAIIGVLAALLFPVAANAKKSAYLRKAKTQLAELETSIDSYKQKKGFYPPDNLGKPISNQLYFELLGAVDNGANVETRDGSGVVQASQIKTFFGVDNFLNFGSRKPTEEGDVSQNFFGGQVKPGQTGEFAPGVKVFVGPVEWPLNTGWQPITGSPLNPWRYNSSSPTNNTKSFDLWIDLAIGGKIYRVSNWRKDVETVTLP